MSKFTQQMLIQQRDDLLKEKEHLLKRVDVINTKLTGLNAQLVPKWHTGLKPGQPGFEWPPCEQCGSRSLRCGCD